MVLNFYFLILLYLLDKILTLFLLFCGLLVMLKFVFESAMKLMEEL